MKKWTKQEVDFLKEYYPTKGHKYCAEKLNRSNSSIFNKVKKLKIRKNTNKTKTERLGEKSNTHQGYIAEIIEYYSCINCTIKFNDSRGTIRKKVAYKEFKLGVVNNYFHPTVFGVGYLGTNCNEYRPHRGKWCEMLKRCYYKSEIQTYVGCTVDEQWLNYKNFEDWCNKNYNPKTMQGWHLDKDILQKGNKIYSPETCCFVPREINNLLIKSNSRRGKYPIGVSYLRNRFTAHIGLGNNIRTLLGIFSTPEEAFQAYKVAKERHIKEVADRWKEQITEEVYNALYNYQVEITD